MDTVFYTGDPHQYVAYVSDVTDPAVDVQAQSAAVTEARQPWSVELTSSVQSSGGTFLAGAAFTLSAVVNQDVG
ncbi:hypothetical protein LGT39_00065, partial [Demequina sp. TTPB684]|uniref:hypothetical protein n=1 Tax=Demequina sp. TTPB684 TaxID=2881057 RepID=UPI001CF3416C